MFSRIFKSARSLVSPTPTTEAEAPPPTSWKPIAVPKATPAKKTKSPKAKPSIEQATPDFEEHTHFSAELPIVTPRGSRGEQPLITVTNPTPHRIRVHSPDMVTTRAQQEQQAQKEDSSDDNSITVYVPGTTSTRKSASRKRNATSIDSVVAEGTPSRSAKKRKVAALPVRKKAENLEEEDEESDEMPSIVNSTPVVEIRVNKALVQAAKNGSSAKKHKKFDSDDEQDEEEPVFSTAQESQDIEEEEDSSDDDAPEEVGAQTAVQNVKAQTESAKQAIQSQKQQRRERAAKAQSQPKKSKRQISDTDEEDNAEEEPVSDMDMEDNQLAESDVEDVAIVMSPPRRVNYMVLDKQVKDRVVGQTTYRVNQKQASNLALKVSKDSRNKKEVLLHARGPRPGANRGQVKKSFF